MSTTGNDPAELFEAVTLAGIEESKRLGYNPTRYLLMVKELGAVGAAKRVCAQAHRPTGSPP